MRGFGEGEGEDAQLAALDRLADMAAEMMAGISDEEIGASEPDEATAERAAHYLRQARLGGLLDEGSIMQNALRDAAEGGPLAGDYEAELAYREKHGWEVP